MGVICTKVQMIGGILDEGCPLERLHRLFFSYPCDIQKLTGARLPRSELGLFTNNNNNVFI